MSREQATAEAIRRRGLEYPNGCTHCGIPDSQHGWQYLPGVGVHGWMAPTQQQIKARMQARRTARTHRGEQP